jgi:hypothetical protein
MTRFHSNAPGVEARVSAKGSPACMSAAGLENKLAIESVG